MTIVHVPVGKDIPAFAADTSLLSPEIVHKLAFEPGVGLKNKLLDARASCYPNRKNKETGATEPNPDYSPENAAALVQKVWDNLVAGEWGKERGEAVYMSPLDARIHKLARAMVVAFLKGKNIKVKNVPEEKMAEYTAQVINGAKSAEIRAEAERQLAQEALMAGAEIELGDLT